MGGPPLVDHKANAAPNLRLLIVLELLEALCPERGLGFGVVAMHFDEPTGALMNLIGVQIQTGVHDELLCVSPLNQLAPEGRGADETKG
jgi:hypothetical protein